MSTQVDLFTNVEPTSVSPAIAKPFVSRSTFCYVNGNTMKVNTNNVLDQYFTKKETAKYLYKKTCDIISKYESSLKEFKWVEPSAGDGVFFNLLPKKNRIGIDINPMNDEIIQTDYLKFNLPEKTIVIGNPPFGS
jgi:hypothetical protein